MNQQTGNLIGHSGTIKPITIHTSVPNLNDPPSTTVVWCTVVGADET